MAPEDELARQESIKRIEHNRPYWIGTAVSTGGMLILAAAWVFLMVVGGLIAYLRKPISESQIRSEIERQSRS